MEKTILKVVGMSCDHCVNAITKTVRALPGIGEVVVDLKAGTVTVIHDTEQSSQDKIKLEIEEQGYDIMR